MTADEVIKQAKVMLDEQAEAVRTALDTLTNADSSVLRVVWVDVLTERAKLQQDQARLLALLALVDEAKGAKKSDDLQP